MKYRIEKADGSAVEKDAIYFVLRVDKPDIQGTVARSLVAQYAERMHGRDNEAAMAAVEVHNMGLCSAIGKHNDRVYEKLGQKPNAITKMITNALGYLKVTAVVDPVKPEHFIGEGI